MRVVVIIMSLCLVGVCLVDNKQRCVTPNIGFHHHSEEGMFAAQVEDSFIITQYYGISNFAECVVDSSFLKKKQTNNEEVGIFYNQKNSGATVVYIGFYDNVERKLWKTFFHDVWVEKDMDTYMIKKIESGLWEEHTATVLANDGNCLLLYHEYDAPYGYDEDYKYIEKYDLSKLPKIDKTYIEIERCCKLWYINGYLYYTQEILGGVGDLADYSYSLNRLCIDAVSEREVLAKGFECITMSSDEKYALGYMHLYGKRIVAMLNVETSKCCLYKGVHFLGNRTIYDEERHQFGVDCGDYLKYVKMPREFPFSIIEYRSTSAKENDLFWLKNEIIFK